MYDDDYLWDRSGELDPEVQELENRLRPLRYRTVELRLPGPTRVSLSRSAGAAAAVLLLICAAMYIWQRNDSPHSTNTGGRAVTGPSISDPAKGEVSRPSPTTRAPVVSMSHRVAAPERVRHSRDQRIAAAPLSMRIASESPDEIPSEVPAAEPAATRFSSHIEMTQLLLRSFRNSAAGDACDYSEIAYDKRRSRELLYQNVALKKAAGTSGDLPTEELLGSLEPILLDIANLPDKPSSQEVRSIRNRIQKEEIVAALQAYATPLNTKF